jgi:hypothetical protein
VRGTVLVRASQRPAPTAGDGMLLRTKNGRTDPVVNYNYLFLKN